MKQPIISGLAALAFLVAFSFSSHAQVKLDNDYNSDDLPKFLVISDNYKPEKVNKKDPYHEQLAALEKYLDKEKDVRSRTALLNVMDELGFDMNDLIIRNSNTNNNIQVINAVTDFNYYFIFQRKE